MAKLFSTASLLGLALLGLTYAQPDPATGRGTAGRTTGEPGTGDHGQGMKGLGGAVVQVLCSPQQVSLGQPFTVNVAYQTDIKRPVDIHVDVLNAQTKAFYAGTTIPMDFQKGQVSATVKMSDYAQEPFLWKVFVAPRGEPFPNMLAETGFVAHLGPNTIQSCQPFMNYGEDIANSPNVDYVVLTGVPGQVTRGGTLSVKIRYNLVSTDKASIVASLMRKGPNMLIVANGDKAQRGVNEITLNLPVPADAATEPVYVVATMTPEGGSWESRLAEDRTYNVQLSRRLRV